MGCGHSFLSELSCLADDSDTATSLPAMITKQAFIANQVLRLPQVAEKIAKCRSSIYEMQNPRSPHYDATFPRPIALGARSRGWLAEEVDAWIATKAAQRA